MRIRRVLIALFALGTLGGYGSAIAGAACHARNAAWRHHGASPCGEAAWSAPSAPTQAPHP